MVDLLILAKHILKVANILMIEGHCFKFSLKNNGSNRFTLSRFNGQEDHNLKI